MWNIIEVVVQLWVGGYVAYKHKLVSFCHIPLNLS